LYREERTVADEERAHILVSGKVQGVFFRDSAREQAERLGLSGWVRNRPDGKVEVVVEGDPERLREMTAWCEEGSRPARVESVEVDYGAATGEFRGFEVR
jgi:acylphosphatase